MNNIEISKEKILTYVKVPKSDLVIVGQSERVKQLRALEGEEKVDKEQKSLNKLMMAENKDWNDDQVERMMVQNNLTRVLRIDKPKV